MDQNLAALREELFRFLSMKYDEGVLERSTFEQFLSLQDMKDYKKEGFSMVADLLTITCKEEEQMIKEMYRHAKPAFNLVKIEGLVHKLTGSNKSVGSIKINEGCKAFKEAREKFDIIGCGNAVDQISHEYQRMKPVYLHIIKLERQIHNLVIALPPTTARPRASPPPISLPKASTSGIPRVPLPPTDLPTVPLPTTTTGRRRAPLPPRTTGRRRV
ncbi:hypothetical protein C5167_046812 [Papaver somniferum]|uniref:Histidine-containing phosphotransfer protein n=1 Tax=Papaver somniferum TaxID=3469 RepID=A0A4Y7LEV0_PAPSO|nr:pseudo histidine-containing phosphotransfer protein 6-like isoform X1 [Papaver somniferum]RZC84023.1 hypothetical protein C5167_046812 [Papaver somniferum]